MIPIKNAFKTQTFADIGRGHRSIHFAVPVVVHSSTGKILLGRK